jgi:hypothetical protein
MFQSAPSPAGASIKHFQEEGDVRKMGQKNENFPLRSERRGGVYCSSDRDISDIHFRKNREWFLRELLI